MTNVPGQLRSAVSIEKTVDDPTASRFWKLYVETFGDLATKAVARQLLHEHEFMEEMNDERVDKYLAHDESGQAVAMCTLTNHLETVPWISADYFATTSRSTPRAGRCSTWGSSSSRTSTAAATSSSTWSGR